MLSTIQNHTPPPQFKRGFYIYSNYHHQPPPHKMHQVYLSHAINSNDKIYLHHCVWEIILFLVFRMILQPQVVNIRLHYCAQRKNKNKNSFLNYKEAKILFGLIVIFFLMIFFVIWSRFYVFSILLAGGVQKCQTFHWIWGKNTKNERKKLNDFLR